VTESLGQILLRQTELTAQQLDMALRLQQRRRPRIALGMILLEKGFITRKQLSHALAQQWNLGYLDTIQNNQLDTTLIEGLSLAFLKKQRVLPVRLDQQHLAVALADPLNLTGYDAVLNHIGHYAPRLVSPPTEIDQAISRCFYHDVKNEKKTAPTNHQKKTTVQNLADANLQSTRRDDLLNIANQPPIVKLVNTILFKAVNARASDIHLEPYENEVKVRLRVDGVLHDILSPPPHHVPALISRLKIMADLNIAERRLPQDGQTRIRIGEKQLDVRVSTIPTAGGERVVLRLLDKAGPGLSIDSLGFDTNVRQRFTSLIENPHGIILLTGPTGSGKTSSLYCAINQLNDHQRNILTVEDPIEYELPAVGQMQVKPKIDLTFANCLRHILRQDPDVIMVGEIRDAETADIAVHASLTGHLVLSTLHTNDAASAVTRLIDMGIEPYLLSSSLIAVMAQRLVRLICPDCKTPCKIEPNLVQQIAAPISPQIANGQFYVGAGCESCLNTGYFGRTGLFELLEVDETIRELIARRAAAHTIKQAAISHNMRTLRDDGLRQARAGKTTLEEVLRVTRDSDNIPLESKTYVRS